MSPFNLDDYEPVEDRLREFWKDHPMGRILTEWVEPPGPDTVIVKASIWRGFDYDPSTRWQMWPPGATGFAMEVIGSTPVNKTSALENCETSAIGRALANLGYAAKGKRPSREEMTKAERGADDSRRGKARSEAPQSTPEGDGGAAPAAPAEPSGPTDAQRWMDEFHPGKPHRMKRSETVPKLEYCHQETPGHGTYKCPYAREVAHA